MLMRNMVLLLATVLCLLSGIASAQWQLAKPVEAQGVSLTLSGLAEGGQLVVSEARRDGGRFLVPTEPGETATTVLRRLDQKLRQEFAGNAAGFGYQSAVEGNTLNANLGFPIVLGGNETGFGAIPPPTGMTGQMNTERTEVTFRWSLPTMGEYDRLLLVTPTALTEMEIPGDQTTLKWPVFSRSLKEHAGLDQGQFYFVLWGERDGIPSAPATVFLDGRRNIERLDIAGYRGLPCNWGVFCEPSAKPLFTWEYREEQKPIGWIVAEDGSTTPVLPPQHIILGEKRGISRLHQPRGNSVLFREFLGLEPGSNQQVSLEMRFWQPKKLSEGSVVAVKIVPGKLSGRDQVLRELIDPDSNLFTSPEGTLFSTVSSPVATDSWFKIGGDTSDASKLTLPPEETSLSVLLLVRDLGECPLSFDWLTLEDISGP